MENEQRSFADLMEASKESLKATIDVYLIELRRLEGEHINAVRTNDNELDCIWADRRDAALRLWHFCEGARAALEHMAPGSSDSAEWRFISKQAIDPLTQHALDDSHFDEED